MSALKWVFTIETLFSLFFTATFAADVSFLSRYYNKQTLFNIVIAAIAFSFLYVIHLGSFILFQRR